MPAAWPGITTGVLDCSYTTSHGVLPGVATLAVHPQVMTRAAKVGDLVLADGLGGAVTVVGCLLDSGRVTAGGGSAPRGLLTLLDRRWRWALTSVSGRYNDPDDRDPPDAKPKRLIDLLDVLFALVGETPVFSGVPDVRPLVNWDQVPVAAALSQLCDQHGLRVAPRVDRPETLVCRAGDGGPLPGGSMDARGPGLDPPEPPERVRLFTAPAEYQCRVDLEAVGEDFDGTIKPIGKLSYRPEKDPDWEYSHPPHMVSAVGVGTHTTQEAIQLAARSVFVYYRPRRQDRYGAPVVGGKGKRGFGYVRVEGYDGKGEAWLDWRRVILTDHKVERVKITDANVVTDDPDRKQPGPATVRGEYWPGTLLLANSDREQPNFRIPFQIDGVRNLVVFGQPMIRREDSVVDGKKVTKVLPAILTIECAVRIRDAANQLERHSADLVLGGIPGAVRAVIRDEIQWGRIASYGVPGPADPATGVEDTGYKGFDDQVDADRVAYHLRAVALEYEAKAIDQATYNGVRPDVQLDGAIAQITHAVGGRTYTQASLNTEHSTYVPPYYERKRVGEQPLEEQRRLKLDTAKSKESQQLDQAARTISGL